MKANDQSKQGPETEIGTENPNGPESEGTHGGNVGTDVISPLEGGMVHANVGHEVTLITLSKGNFCTNFYVR
jgi:hypothetical protein